MGTNSLLDFLRHAARHPYAILPGAPSGIINSAQEWVAHQQKICPVDIRRGPAACYWDFDPLELRSFPAPNTVDSAPQLRALRVFPTPATQLFFFRGAHVISGDGVVISPDNRVFAEFTYVDEGGGIGSHSIFRRRRFPRAQPLAGWYATICYPSSAAYYHWIVESLPRLRFLEPHLSALDGIFVPKHITKTMRESLFMMGVKEAQLIPLDVYSHFVPEHLLVPKFCAGLDIPDWVPRYLCGRLFPGQPSSVPTRRIYVSRAKAGKRRILNEEAFTPLLKQWGFEIIHPQNLSFAEQIELFRSAKVVVGPSGAGLSNAMFCQPSSTLVTLNPSPKMGPHVFYSLASAVGMAYWDLAGQPFGADDGGTQEHADFEIDPKRLNQTIEAILDKPNRKS